MKRRVTVWHQRAGPTKAVKHQGQGTWEAQCHPYKAGVAPKSGHAEKWEEGCLARTCCLHGSNVSVWGVAPAPSLILGQCAPPGHRPRRPVAQGECGCP